VRRVESCMAPGVLGFVVSAVAFAGGCTICPSPFDYSGPVPNGSVTQNDFCARSGGNRPLRSGPLVWPPVVKTDAPSSTQGLPTEAATPEVLVASMVVEPEQSVLVSDQAAHQADPVAAPGENHSPETVEHELVIPSLSR
jgi:hypothetical protein